MLLPVTQRRPANGSTTSRAIPNYKACSTGRGLMALIRERFPRPVLWLAVFLVVSANTFNIGADLGSMAAAFRLLLPVPFALLVVAFAAVTVLLEVFIPYERYS